MTHTGNPFGQVLVALVTPMTADGEVDWPAVEKHIDSCITAGADAPVVIVTRSEAYGRSQALGAAADILRGILGLPKGVSVTESKAALVECLGAETTIDETTASHELIARLLSNVPLPDGIDPRGARDVLWLGMTDLVLQVSSEGALAIITEDLQWADEESIDWLDHLVGRSQNQALLIVAAMRPGFWSGTSRRFSSREHVRLDLRPVTKRAIRMIARSLLGDSSTPETLEQIVQQAGGLPLFAEELSRLSAAGGDTSNAPTIETAIQASLDGLDEECRDAVGRLSVFGLTCWDGGLEAVGMVEAEGLLRELARRELLLELQASRFSGSSEWVFKHALVREVAYSSLGKKESVELHALAGKWLAGVGEDSAIVAGHFDLGDCEEQAADHWAQAAQRALATNALSDALRMAERALAFADDKQTGFLRAGYLDEAWSRLDPRASDRENAIWALEENVYDDLSSVRARGARARYEVARGGGANLSDSLADIRNEASKLELYDEESRCSAALATQLAFAGDFPEAESEAHRLLGLAQIHGVRTAAVDGWQTLAIIHQTHGALSSALDARRNAVGAAHNAGLRERESILTTNLGFALTTIGARQESLRLLEAGYLLADAIGSQGALRHARMILMGWAGAFGNDKRIDQMVGDSRLDADASVTGTWTSPDRENLGMLYYRGCELLRSSADTARKRALSLLRTAANAYRNTNNHDVLPVALGMWATAELQHGDSERALEIALEAAELREADSASLLNESPVYLALHDALVHADREDEAREAVATAIPPLLRRVHGLASTPYARLFLTELQPNARLVSAADDYGILPAKIRDLIESGSA